MRKIGLLLVFAASLSFAQRKAADPVVPVAPVLVDSPTPTQLTQVPPKPTCIPYALFSGAACNDLWNAYKQALAQRQQQEFQLHVNRQKELVSAQVTVPLQQQIADLNKLTTDQQDQIKKLQEQMQADAVAAVEAKADAHTAGLQKGAGLGAGGMLLLVGIVFGIRKFTQGFNVTKKEQAKAASA
jgi:hypothetical protein